MKINYLIHRKQLSNITGAKQMELKTATNQLNYPHQHCQLIVCEKATQ